jgi:protein-tyrosine phosphatase
MKYYLPEILILVLLGLGQWWILAGWCLLSMLLCGLSYLWIGPKTFGKDSAGNIPLLNRFIHTPWMWEYRIIVALDRWSGREGVNEISPGLWLGRRLLAREVPPGIELVVDLTAESAMIRDLPGEPDYMCLPTLDGQAPDEQAFRELVKAVSLHRGPVLIHCARGHGRSATVMAAVLMRRGIAEDIEAASVLMKSKRKRVYLHRGQRRLLNSLG